MESKIEGNQNYRGWNKVRRCEEDLWVPGTAGTAWRQPIGRQAPYQWGVVLWFRKNAIFCTFRGTGTAQR